MDYRDFWGEVWCIHHDLPQCHWGCTETSVQIVECLAAKLSSRCPPRRDLFLDVWLRSQSNAYSLHSILNRFANADLLGTIRSVESFSKLICFTNNDFLSLWCSNIPAFVSHMGPLKHRTIIADFMNGRTPRDRFSAWAICLLNFWDDLTKYIEAKPVTMIVWPGWWRTRVILAWLHENLDQITQANRWFIFSASDLCHSGQLSTQIGHWMDWEEIILRCD